MKDTGPTKEEIVASNIAKELLNAEHPMTLTVDDPKWSEGYRLRLSEKLFGQQVVDIVEVADRLSQFDDGHVAAWCVTIRPRSLGMEFADPIVRRYITTDPDFTKNHILGSDIGSSPWYQGVVPQFTMMYPVDKPEVKT